MRKRFITPTSESIRTSGEGWLDVERTAVVEVTSEEETFPVESVFNSGDARGWRAAQPGSQTIRLVFDQPQTLKHISLVFEENERMKLPGHRSSFCGGLRMRGAQSGKLCASSGTSVHLVLYERSRTTKWIFQRLVYSN